MADKTYSPAQSRELKSQTDHDRLRRMSEAEIERNAEQDPDARSPTIDDLKRFKRVQPHTA